MAKTKLFDSIFIPASSKGVSSKEKLMIIMHGLGDQKESFVDLAAEINVTGLSYLLIDGPTPYYFGFSWYNLEEPLVGIRRNIDKLAALIQELNDQGIASEDIFLSGFSQGGCMAISTFLKLNIELAGVACLSPRMYLNDYNLSELSSNKTPIFVGHGHYDEAIPFQQTQKESTKLKEAGLNITFKDYLMGHEIDPIEVKDLRFWLNEFL